MIPWLLRDDPFPPLSQALAEPNGLLAAGGDLSAPRLLAAYRRGIFPWFNPGEPVLWWSPDPRMVLFPDEFKLSRSLKKTLRRADHEVRTDTAFQEVMRACAEPRQGHSGSWITADMLAAYTRLFTAGHAHSVETWRQGRLVGGLYGVAVGCAFYGESMFARETDASKIALAHLVAQLRRWDYGLIDCQMHTRHLASLGAREIPRGRFVSLLAELIDLPSVPGPWTFDHDLVA
ncbi:MAG TPA: leucyl/phenylalanyl-tRNA--protein transferase [Thiobacillaceae bacterium]|nr:leucyl/phenylalanyl-tRNA--protein transferase [Thiobacillaceae bacterium]